MKAIIVLEVTDSSRKDLLKVVDWIQDVINFVPALQNGTGPLLADMPRIVGEAVSENDPAIHRHLTLLQVRTLKLKKYGAALTVRA
jgi:hypothetical protein